MPSSSLDAHVVVSANPKAAGGRVARDFGKDPSPMLAALGQTQMRWTRWPKDASTQTRNALRAGCRHIVAIGGDGTLNEVVNGFWDGSVRLGDDDAVLTLIPAGTGSDFARSLGWGKHAVSVEAVASLSVRRVDVVELKLIPAKSSSLQPMVRRFINIASVGCSGEIAAQTAGAPKRFLRQLSFAWHAMRAFACYAPRLLTLQLDDAAPQHGDAMLVAIANGRFFGGGMMIAPHASTMDGLLDGVWVGGWGGPGSVLQNFAAFVPRRAS